MDKSTAIVTGGASGLGQAVVCALRARGMQVMVWDKQLLTHDSESILCDVSSSDSVTLALEQTIARFGIPSVCVNCAGIAPAARMARAESIMPLNAFKQVMDINLVGTFNVMRVVSHAMIKRDACLETGERGIIINTASIAAFEGQIGQIAYSASKGGIVSMTLPAARELAQYGIRVNAIAPGVMATPMLLALPEVVQDSLAASVPFPKRLGKPEEFASLVMHLIDNALINGEVIRLDGALRMPPR